MFGAMNGNDEAHQSQVMQEGQIMNNEPRSYSQPPPPGHPYDPQVQTRDSRRKSPALATILSSFPGLGQVYVGYYQTGFMFALTIAVAIAVLNTKIGTGLRVLVAISLAFFWIFNMIDANRRAQHYNLVLAGLDGEEIPEGFKAAGGMGSMPVGLILVVVGVLIMLDLNFGVSLEWLENWWPLLLVGFGGWLMFKARQKGE